MTMDCVQDPAESIVYNVMKKIPPFASNARKDFLLIRMGSVLFVLPIVMEVSAIPKNLESASLVNKVSKRLMGNVRNVQRTQNLA